MPTYTKETALYDTGAIKNGIDDAGKTAKGYMTNVSNDGVFVHEYSSSDVQPTTTGANGVHIASGVDIVQNGKVSTSYGSTTIFYKPGTTTKAAEIGSFGLKITDGIISLGSKTSATDTTNNGTYIDSSGNLGTNLLKAGGGSVGGWTIGSNIIYASHTNTDQSTSYTLLKNSGDVAIAAGSPSTSNTTGAGIQIFHDGRMNAGNYGGTNTESWGYDLRIANNSQSYFRSISNERDSTTGGYPTGWLTNGGFYSGLTYESGGGEQLSIRIKNYTIYGYNDMVIRTDTDGDITCRSGGSINLYATNAVDISGPESITLTSNEIYRGSYKFINASDVSGSNLTCFGNNEGITRVASKTTSTSDTGTSFMIANGYYAIGSSSDHSITYNNAAVYISGGTDSTARWLCMPPIYNRTYGSAANVYITGNGVLGRSTSSSRRYKHDINPVTDEALDILDIPVRTFKYNEGYVTGDPDFDYDKPITGFIAEEVADICPDCATYTDEDGKERVPESWNEREFIPRMLYVLQKQQKEIEDLKRRMSA